MCIRDRRTLLGGMVPRTENVPNGASGLYLLGQINERQQQWSSAKEAYLQALELNPTLWCAYERVCRLGHELPNKIFNETKMLRFEASGRRNASCSFIATSISRTLRSSPQRSAKKQMEEEGEAEQTQAGGGGGNASSGTKVSRGLNTYNLKASIISGSNQSVVNSFTINFDEGSSISSMRVSRAQPGSITAGSLSPNPNLTQAGKSGRKAPPPQAGQQGGQQDQRQMASFSIYSGQGQGQGPGQGQGQAQGVPQQKSSPHVNISLVGPSPAPVKDLMGLLVRLGQAYSHMCLYMMEEAISFFQQLPPKHFNSSWTKVLVGRCYLETTRYSEAERYFAEAFQMEPYRLEGLEYYSTCLWHLKKGVDLAYVANAALERSLYAPESWICVGNCFSLQKEHENALKFFSRAIQLNPTFAYAHCLCGHEYVYNEDWARAKRCFEQALSYDIRNYNAWWGLGNICLKQEKFDKAADHFSHALSINGKNPVLYTYLGMTMACKDALEEALRNFEKAEMLDKNNVLNKFQKANVLVRMGHFDLALKELDRLRLLMPRESPIPVLMGKIYKKLGKNDKAHYFFNIALDLESKESQKIKGLIESLHTQNEFNEDFEL
eukprot:TRINITY_DN4303_c0_g4_i2.p1 TRINITY_DN4303_c0_g4~~TRINITY_DN4303_c0_g4_i2.p1  ORF type:complete len:628 (-),score=153.75 TRINITY_DN4303_c0_g4_i2:164-1987(-)